MPNFTVSLPVDIILKADDNEEIKDILDIPSETLISSLSSNVIFLSSSVAALSSNVASVQSDLTQKLDLNGSNVSDFEVLHDDLDVDDSKLNWNYLWKWRNGLANYKSPVLATLGDSMINTARQTLRQALWAELGFAGFAFAESYPGGGAAKSNLSFDRWFNGKYCTLSANGHTATVNIDSSVPIEGNKLKLYYVTQPGGGDMIVETRKNGVNPWMIEVGLSAVQTNTSSMSAGIITIDKTSTSVRDIWEIRGRWLSGGRIDVIGGAVFHTGLYGARFAELENGNTDMSSYFACPSAILEPIIRDVSPDLFLLSHLDGAAGVPAQVSFQDTLNRSISATPSWVVIGPPVGPNISIDAANKLQADTQRLSALSRKEVFWDNRKWALPAISAVANGFLPAVPPLDPHLTGYAQYIWIPNMLRDLRLAEGILRGDSGPAQLKPTYSPAIRRNVFATGTFDRQLEICGELTIANSPGLGNAGLRIENQNGIAGDPVEWGGMTYTGTTLNLIRRTATLYSLDTGVGRGAQFYAPASTASNPQGQIGTGSSPVREVNIGKIFYSTLSDTYNMNTCSGRIGFAAGNRTVYINNTSVGSNSIIMANLRSIDTTATAIQSVSSQSVSAQPGRFFIMLNAAPTANVEVDWFLIP